MLSQTDASTRLNVSRSAVQRHWDKFESDNSKSRTSVLGHLWTTTPVQDRILGVSARSRRITTVPKLISDHRNAIGMTISTTTVRRHYHNQGFYPRCPVVCDLFNRPFIFSIENCPFTLKSRFLDLTAMRFCTLHTRVAVFFGE